MAQTPPHNPIPDIPSYSPGLEGVIAGESALCLVDEGDRGLRYRGYAVTELAEQSSFEEVAFLLLHGKLPTQQELEEFRAHLQQTRTYPDLVDTLLRAMPPTAHPMDILRSAVSLLGILDPEANDHAHLSNMRKAVRLLGQVPLITGRAYQLMHGKQGGQPDSSMSTAETLLVLLTDRKPDDAVFTMMARVLDVSLILYAEHELNASTFAARVAASTLTDLYGAITAAIATLKGPLHGGANEAVARMFIEIGSQDRAEEWVHNALKRKQRIMGFGHRVLKKGDIRSAIIKRHAEQLSNICGDTRWFNIATTVDRIMQEEKGLHPNLDFYTAVVYLLMGIPQDWYTPVFVCSRLSGWCAHVIEQQDHNRLIRPRALYTGPPPQSYVPIDQRH
ncbi:MAG: citrate synthase [Nitrospirae bacterium]|nr:MAG: citrate synthase [Nitrospirota bacterium]